MPPAPIPADPHAHPRFLSGTPGEPLIKWAGGKARLVSVLGGLVARARWQAPRPLVYVEPFLGAGGSLLGLLAGGCLDGMEVRAADLNPTLVAMHRAVRDAPDTLFGLLCTLPTENTEATFYAVREVYNASDRTSAFAAACLIWLNRAGYNGLYRENKAGGYNVPWNRADGPARIPSWAWIKATSALLQGVEIDHAGFGETLGAAGLVSPLASRTLFYCDPPYLPEGEAGPSEDPAPDEPVPAAFTSYTGDGFDLAAQRELSRLACRAAVLGHDVLLSNHGGPLTRRVYRDPPWTQAWSGGVQRSISRGDRTAAREVVLHVGPGDLRPRPLPHTAQIAQEAPC